MNDSPKELKKFFSSKSIEIIVIYYSEITLKGITQGIFYKKPEILNRYRSYLTLSLFQAQSCLIGYLF